MWVLGVVIKWIAIWTVCVLIVVALQKLGLVHWGTVLVVLGVVVLWEVSQRGSRGGN